jgi:hypothetical protein
MTASDQPVKQKCGWRILSWLGGALFVFLLIGVALPSFGPLKNGCQMGSASQMYQIGITIVAYRRDHQGTYPQRLSELVPDYASPAIFYCRCKYATAFVPSKFDKELKLIAAFSAYGLLTLDDGRAVVFERLSMWSDHTIGFFIVPKHLPEDDKELKLAFDLPLRNRLPQDDFARQYLKSFNP